MSWINVTHLCLFNLMKRNPKKMFFRLKEDICGIINEYWEYLWPSKVRTNSWENTVASAVSMNTNIFKSGLEVMKQSGWWGLISFEPPFPLAKRGTKLSSRRSLTSKEGKSTNSDDDENEKINKDSVVDSKSNDMIDALAKLIASKADSDIYNPGGKASLAQLSFLDPDGEWQLLERIEAAKACPVLNRLKRKLILRRYKRTVGMKIFDLDKSCKKYIKATSPVYEFESKDIADCENKDEIAIPYVINPRLSLHCKLFGHEDEPSTQVSTFTHRRLKHFIWRDYECNPMKLAIMKELSVKINTIHPRRDFNFVFHPIDYVYFQPKYLKQVNNLLSQFFWPGIDLTEALNYPDFSIVALYGKLVIGAGFMTPAAYITYFFVHPDWERSGIGTFMMYHLIQSCQGKDITLHVSATNSAMILYQKFGFKPEQFIVNFYDKYYAENDVRFSKNALFVRLRR